jgi:hypothetical protein
MILEEDCGQIALKCFLVDTGDESFVCIFIGI